MMAPQKDLGSAAPRRRLHTRQVLCEGYEREDGLFEVEGRLTDTKTSAVEGVRGNTPRVAGEPIHLMVIRLILDETFLIVGAEARTQQAPYAECRHISNAYSALVGLRIEPGFITKVKKLFRASAGCTHLTELLGPVATTALQSFRTTIERRRQSRGETPGLADPSNPHLLLGTCWGLRRGSPAAITRWGDIAKVDASRPHPAITENLGAESAAPTKKASHGGPLAGIRIIEFAGIGPGPFGAMLLSDLGADIVRIERPSGSVGHPHQLLTRGRRTVQLDLKQPHAVAEALDLISQADVVIEGFRPGVMERLGLGPDVVSNHNRKLVYARVTGFGQFGPLSQTAGHDINYIALAGALAPIGYANSPPVIPLNLIGDFGGGGMYLALGVIAALYEAKNSGMGQVIDAAICDGVASLMTSNAAQTLRGSYVERRESNMLDGAAPYYSVYQTADGLFVAIGAIEAKFFSNLCTLIGVREEFRSLQHDRSRWPELRNEIATCFSMRSRDEWCRILGNQDACFSPVLSLSEAMQHPHMKARGTFLNVDGIWQPAPAPRFSRTNGNIQPTARQPYTTSEVLAGWRKCD